MIEIIKYAVFHVRDIDYIPKYLPEILGKKVNRDYSKG